MTVPRICIVGGGLAGMVTALRLAERGVRVTLLESSQRLGGKAGARQSEMGWEEHGYHVFPMWYLNAWHLVEELGIGNFFVESPHFHQLDAGAFPRFKTITNMTSFRWAFRNVGSGVLPVPEAFLFAYATLDLATQPYRYRSQLDQVTVSGFLRSRFYRTERVGRQFQQLVLKGISVPSYEVSAMTMRNVLRFWIEYPEPMQRILAGNLQELWIDPLRRRMEQLGVEIRYGHRLLHVRAPNKKVSRLAIQTESGETTIDVERVLLALPVERTLQVLDDSTIATSTQLAALKYLRTRPMAALNIYFKRKVDGIPRGHVNTNGRFGLSFIDVSQFWPGLQATALNIIASDFTPLEGLPPKLVEAALIADLQSFLPFEVDDIARIDLQSHESEPLFMNNVGGWAFRPSAATDVAGLFLAGDFCRNHIDLVSMEGAIVSGLLAAKAILTDAKLADDIQILRPRPYPHIPLKLLVYALSPIAAAAKLLSMATERQQATTRTDRRHQALDRQREHSA